MPLLYGEGARKAFFRLQEEIMRHSSDHTLFTWTPAATPSTVGLLADSPSRFSNSTVRYTPLDRPPQFIQDICKEFTSRPYSLANNALQMSLPMLRYESCLPNQCYAILLNCIPINRPNIVVMLHLRKDETSGIWYRSVCDGRMNYILSSVDESFRRVHKAQSLPGGSGTIFSNIQVRGTW